MENNNLDKSKIEIDKFTSGKMSFKEFINYGTNQLNKRIKEECGEWYKKGEGK